MECSSNLLIAYTTFPTRKMALEFSRKCLEKKLIACSNIVGSGESVYLWEGKICQEQESFVLMKTIPEKYIELENFLKSEHPYKTPCLWAVQSDKVLPAYLQWVQETTIF